MHHDTSTTGRDHATRGASVIEYLLLLSLIVLVCLASLRAFGNGVSEDVDHSSSRVVAAVNGEN